MFSGKEEEHQELQKVERLIPSEKLKRTFRKYEVRFCFYFYSIILLRFEEFGSSIDQNDDEQDNDEDGLIHSSRKNRTPKEHVCFTIFYSCCFFLLILVFS